MKLSILSLAMLLALFSACSKDAANDNEAPATPEKKAAPAAAEGAGGHAAADVEPGSHGDWCGEHAVPESQCTRCNPKLAAAFKATGDWCEEHGLPESQCTLCNPELEIVRPPAADGKEE